MKNYQLREGLTELPLRMKDLPVDERGYPAPWFVEWVDGKPEFRAMNREKWHRAIAQRLCWVCGTVLGRNMVFVAGCMCGINRTSSEPPNHYECAKWSAINCPFLNNPEMVRREDEVVNNQQFRDRSAGFAIARNPGVAMLWVTRSYEVFPDGKGRYLITMGEPERVEWYKRGRPATRGEVMQSIDSGLPNLEAMARLEKGGLEALEKARQRFWKWLPEAKDGAVLDRV